MNIKIGQIRAQLKKLMILWFVIQQIGIFQQMEWSTTLKQIAVGLVSGFIVSPSNAILDKSVTEYANGKATVSQGVKDGFNRLIYSPLSFFASFKFRWMYFVYGMTYVSNNLSDRIQWNSSVPLPLQNLLATFLVNTLCGISKDKAFAQHFGISHPKPFPVASLALMLLRDIITVASAFTFPPVLGKMIERSWGYSEHTSKVIGQLLCPLLVQLVVTPLHLLGLDIYNREGVPFGKRALRILEQYPKTAGMLPAGLWNRRSGQHLAEKGTKRMIS